MVRRNLFVVVVLLALILSAAFTSWTENTSGAGTSVPLAVSSWPPDLKKYTRPATSHDVVSKTNGASTLTKGASTPMSLRPVEVPDSGGGEPDIAINPQNLNQIVIHAGFFGWNGNAPNFVSNDGGMTWSTSNQIPPPPGVAVLGPADTTQDYGPDGNLYSANLAFNIPIFNTDVFSSSNTNPFANVFSYFLVGRHAQRTDFNGTLGGADQPWLLTNVDPGTPGQTDTYVGYDDFNTFPIAMRVSVATGTSPPDFVTDNASGLHTGGGVNPGHRLAVDPRTGAVYSLYQICLAGCGTNSKTIGYILNRSLDAGTTWTLNGLGTGALVATGTTVQPTPKFGTVNALLGGIDHAAVDPTNGDVYVVYGDGNGVGGNAIFIKQITFDTSTPSNASEGFAHQVSLPPVLSTDSAALPSVAVASDGTVGVLYTSFDGFSVDGFPIFSAHFASSTDAGTTFKDQTILTFLSPATDDGDPRQRVLGDYQQLKTVNGPNAGATFYGVFTGNGAALGDPIANNNAFFFKASAAQQINPATVSITNPAADSTVSATVPFSCTDTAPDAIVGLYIDDVYVAGGNSPFTFSWDTTAASNGSHYLVCNGYVNGISNGSAAENVTVNNVSNPPQTISITSPAANSTVSATVPFSCTDTAPDAVVNLYIDDVYVAGGNSPFTFSWDTTAASNGSHYLVCNGYVNGGTNGSAAEDVSVSN